MRNALATLLIHAPALLHAQTVITVQNGPWTTPTTWDCNCVPAPGSSLVIMHSVEILNDLTFSYPQVQVMSTGEITMSFPANVILGGTFIIEGHVLLIGWVSNAGGTIDVSGFFEVVGEFSSDGDLIMDGGTMQVEGNFTNYLSVSGDGSICVYDTTANLGTITGTVDICDATPTTATAPILDQNSGTVAGTVTFCTNSVCGFAGVDDHRVQGISVGMDPSGTMAFVNGLPSVPGELRLRDTAGRVVWSGRSGTGGNAVIDAPGPGVFVLELASAMGLNSWKLIFAGGASR